MEEIGTNPATHADMEKREIGDIKHQNSERYLVSRRVSAWEMYKSLTGRYHGAPKGQGSLDRALRGEQVRVHSYFPTGPYLFPNTVPETSHRA